MKEMAGSVCAMSMVSTRAPRQNSDGNIPTA